MHSTELTISSLTQTFITDKLASFYSPYIHVFFSLFNYTFIHISSLRHHSHPYTHSLQSSLANSLHLHKHLPSVSLTPSFRPVILLHSHSSRCFPFLLPHSHHHPNFSSLFPPSFLLSLTSSVTHFQTSPSHPYPPSQLPSLALFYLPSLPHSLTGCSGRLPCWTGRKGLSCMPTPLPPSCLGN